MTDNTIGICNSCGALFPHDDPRIGYFCNQTIIVHKDKKEWTEKCRGAVIRHVKKESQ